MAITFKLTLVKFLVAVTFLFELSEGKLIDMRREVSNVIRRHNRERSSRHLKASDMLEMTWDDGLAAQAGDYAERCRYEYPPLETFDVGSNLYYEMDFVHGAKSVRRLVNSALRSWTRAKDFFKYSSHCQRACSYVQMIMAQSDKIGCALSTCTTLNNGDIQETFASFFVCFYAPRVSIQASFPFKTGFACSECPEGSICRDGLCSKLGYEAVPHYIQDNPDMSQVQRDEPALDSLSESEKYYLTSGHNRQRDNNNRDKLDWDPYLEEWAKWIVNCHVDYPGPSHCYTNFHRLDHGDQVYRIPYDWSTEGDTTSIQLIHGCRTPYDNSRCNHYTNILQPVLTSMACAAKDCKDNSRQVVCLYDNKVDRAFRPSRSTGSSHDVRRRYRRSRFQ